MTNKKHIIFGAGITGLSAAHSLAKTLGDQVVLVEKQSAVGGLAATIQHEGFSFDLGSHRIHAGVNPKVLDFLKTLLGDQLLLQKRSGSILVEGRFLRYPPTVFDIASSFGWTRTARYLLSAVSGSVRRYFRPAELHTFEAYARAYVGRGLYQAFYRPYAVKLWGMPPEQISDEPARKRVRKSLRSELKRALRLTHPSQFFYPAQGIGQIAETLADNFTSCGGRLLLNCVPEKLSVDSTGRIDSVTLKREDGNTEEIGAKSVVSTLPIPQLHALLENAAPEEENKSMGLRWRGLRLLFLITRDRVPDAVETYYFPGSDLLMGRVSQIGKFSSSLVPPGDYQSLTLEIPCSEGDEIWNMDDQTLKGRCLEDLCRFGILRSKLSEEPQAFSLRLKNVYPLYTLGWKTEFERLREFYSNFKNLYTVGRSALFMQCNLDHCITMGEAAAAFLMQSDPCVEEWWKQVEEFLEYYVRE